MKAHDMKEYLEIQILNDLLLIFVSRSTVAILAMPAGGLEAFALVESTAKSAVNSVFMLALLLFPLITLGVLEPACKQGKW